MQENGQIIIKQGQRVLVAGKTGSGKTYASMTLLLPVPRMIVFDPKADLAEWRIEKATDSNIRDFINGGAGRLAIYDRAQLIALLERFARENVTHYMLYIDEMYALVPPGKPIPDILNTLYTRGRSSKISVWTVTQRPVWVPLVSMSESEWFFGFRLNMPDDRKRLADVSGHPQFNELVRDPYGFYVYNNNWEKPRYVKELKIAATPITLERSQSMPRGTSSAFLVKGR